MVGHVGNGGDDQAVLWTPERNGAAKTAMLAECSQATGDEIIPLKGSNKAKIVCIDDPLRRPIYHYTLIRLSRTDVTAYRDYRLSVTIPP